MIEKREKEEEESKWTRERQGEVNRARNQREKEVRIAKKALQDVAKKSAAVEKSSRKRLRESEKGAPQTSKIRKRELIELSAAAAGLITLGEHSAGVSNWNRF